MRAYTLHADICIEIIVYIHGRISRGKKKTIKEVEESYAKKDAKSYPKDKSYDNYNRETAEHNYSCLPV